jgi:hypothetical protein
MHSYSTFLSSFHINYYLITYIKLQLYFIFYCCLKFATFNKNCVWYYLYNCVWPLNIYFNNFIMLFDLNVNNEKCIKTQESSRYVKEALCYTTVYRYTVYRYNMTRSCVSIIVTIHSCAIKEIWNLPMKEFSVCTLW